MVLTPLAIVLLLTKKIDGKEKLLLHRRSNTGFCDGQLDMSCSGHVEEGETFFQAAVREAKEELGIKIEESDLKFSLVMHKRDKGAALTYVKLFLSSTCKDEPKICESDKCSFIGWFDVDDLPESQMMSENIEAFRAIKRGENYLEYGWKN